MHTTHIRHYVPTHPQSTDALFCGMCMCMIMGMGMGMGGCAHATRLTTYWRPTAMPIV